MLADALLDIAQGNNDADEDRLVRALAHFMAQRLGPGMPVGPELFADLFALLFAFGLAVAPAIGAVFRTLVTLQGTLALLDADFQMVDEARAIAAEWAHAFAAPGSLRKTATDELLTLLPMLRRLPRRLDHLTASLERGTLSVNVRLLSDERDARLISQLVSRAVLAFLGAALGLISVLLLGLKGGPALNATLGVYQAFGYAGLFFSVVLILRIVIVIAREGVGP
jgi:ubiquinone biosynthesis protein